MPRGGKREGAGRRPGSQNESKRVADATIGERARKLGPAALAALERVAKGSKSDAAVVSAANGILDRGYGRPMQSMEHTGAGGGPIKHDFSVYTDEQLAALRDIQRSAVARGASVPRSDRGGDTPAGGEAKR